MKYHSIRLRLLFLAGLSIASVLCLIGFGLYWLLQNQLLAQTHTALGHQLNQLAAVFSLDNSGAAVVEDAMTDPRYDRPLSGLYWQVSKGDKAILRSRSLWDTRLPEILQTTNNSRRPISIAGPGHSRLVSLSRIVAISSPSGDNKANLYRLVVAVDTTEMENNRNEIFRLLTLILALSGLALIGFAWAQIQFGLRPLDAVRQNLELVRHGGRKQLHESSFPSEVQPLVHEINDLLAAQRIAVDQARRRSGDLAHGLKTPIAAIAAQIDRMEGSGNETVHETIRSYLEAMRRHVEKELARVRAQGGDTRLNHVTDVGLEVNNVIDVLKKLPTSEGVNWTVDIEPNMSVAMEKEDLSEVLGNLLDNARKWAKSQVIIKACPIGRHVRVSVEDDGPGIEQADLPNAIVRGTRLDEGVPGTGLGLSIVQAILETYSSVLKLKRSSIGGLKASFEISDHQNQKSVSPE